MQSIMLDNSSIHGMINYLGGNASIDYYDDFDWRLTSSARFIEQSWDNFLTAIILWDKVWTFNKNPVENWCDFYQIKGLKKQFIYLEDVICFVENKMIAKDLYLNYRAILSDIYENNIKIRTTYYEALSDSIGVPFLAHPIRDYHILDSSHCTFNRIEIIDKIEAEMQEYYDHLNKTLSRTAFNFKSPLFVDYIISEASTKQDQLTAAIELRNRKDIIAFRKEMESIERDIALGNTQLWLSQLENVSKIAHEITTKYKKVNIGNLTVTISTPPSISLEIKSPFRMIKKPHITFIRKLFDYGVYERYNRYW